MPDRYDAPYYSLNLDSLVKRRLIEFVSGKSMRRLFVFRHLLCVWLIVGLGGCAHLIYPVTERSTNVFHIETSDGWSIAIHHYAPKGSKKQSTPVLLCHGISSNKYNWDLNDEYSFPSYIAAKGFDTSRARQY